MFHKIPADFNIHANTFHSIKTYPKIWPSDFKIIRNKLKKVYTKKNIKQHKIQNKWD